MKQETAQNIFMALLMIGMIFAIFWVMAEKLKNSQGDNFSCEYWNKNKTECFCGNTFDNGAYEHMQMGVVLNENICCPKSSNLCWEIEQ